MGQREPRSKARKENEEEIVAETEEMEEQTIEVPSRTATPPRVGKGALSLP